ncbi:MAG: hypothetical protein ACTSX4_14185 [Candidatus Helarchaeota archaeon]
MEKIPYNIKILVLILVLSGIGLIIASILINTPLLGVLFANLNYFSASSLNNLIDFNFIYCCYVLPFLPIHTTILIFIGSFLFILAISLMRLYLWSYKVALIISIPATLFIIGIFMIWFLTQDDVKNAFLNK